VRLRVAIGVLALAGAGVAAYLTWVHYHPAALVCLRGSSGCETVNGSRYATIGGIPVAALGLAVYLLVLVSAAIRDVLAAAAASALTLAGLAFALWLVYVQAALLHAWCVWCLTSDGILVALTALCAWRLVRALEPA
jgi:uncharacterized membrane protein